MKKIFSSKKFLIGAIIAIVLIVATAIISTIVLIPLTKYKQAQKAFESGNFTEAMQMFQNLDYYKDSPWQVVRCERALARKKISDEEKIITFGTYEQDGILENGAEPIEWVVDTYDDKTKTATLISLHILDGQPINNSESKTNNWKNSEIQKWLNSTFINQAFSLEQQAVMGYMATLNNYFSDEADLVYTTEKVSLLSIKKAREISKYDYSGKVSEYAKATAYAKEHGAVDDVYWTSGQQEINSEKYIAGDFSSRLFLKSDSDKIHGIRPIIKVDLDY